MRLLSCYIAGFGRLVDESFEFNEGLNVFLHENGWGKTTFSTFIKAMLYGMDYAPRKKELTERSHYMPWESSSYGGSLTIDVEGKKYRIERSFGRTDKEDTFALYDLTTGRESEDCSEKIGEELFGTDKESYEKSIFMPQNSLGTGMTDSLNAKMGNLTSARDDISNFDDAISRLSEKYKEYTRNSKNPGKLIRVRSEIRECKEALEQEEVLSDAYSKQESLLKERFARLRELNNKKTELQNSIAEQSKKEQELGAYREKKNRLQEVKNTLDSLDDVFSGGVPDPEEVKANIEKERGLEVNARELEERKQLLPSPEKSAFVDRLFAEHLPTDEEMTEWTEEADRLRELRIQGEHAVMSEEDKNTLQDLKVYFRKKKPTADEIRLASEQAVYLAKLDGQISELQSSCQETKERRVRQMREDSEKGLTGPGSIVLVLLLGLILICGGLAFLFFVPGFLGTLFAIICFGIAGVEMTLGFLFIWRSRKNVRSQMNELDEKLASSEEKLSELSSTRDEVDGKLKAFLSDYLVSAGDTIQQMIAEIQRKADLHTRLLEEESRLMNKNSETLEELTELQLKLYTALTPYSSVYGFDLYSDAKETELINLLKERAADYKVYNHRKEAVKELQENVDKGRWELLSFLQRFRIQENDKNVQDQLNGILLSIDQYNNLSAESEKLTEEISEFESTHDVNTETESVEELQSRQETLDAEIGELNQFIVKEEEDLSDLSEKLSNLDDQRERLNSLQEAEAEYKAKADLLEKTLFYLQEAKDNFLSKYMAPLQNGLNKYLKILEKETGADIHISDFSLDMDLTVHFTYQGTTRNGDYLSEGYKDLVALCSRMALIDVLYRKEYPMVIMDDPFTNLDEVKIKNALSLLKKVSRNRQIIYFTCHESRAL